MSFQTGLAGLNAASRNLDVIGNNIANANTIGAKASRAEFALSAKVTRLALQNAASIASLLLTTDCLIATLPTTQHGSAAQPAGGMTPDF